MTAYDAEFAAILQEYIGLIKYAAKRYSVPGLLDKEDLVQEGMLILDQLLEDNEFDPTTPDFRRMFKTLLWHGLASKVSAFRAQKRDFRKLVYENDTDDEGGDTSGSWLVSSDPSPEQLSASIADAEVLRNFLETLLARLDDEAKGILQEILSEKSWEEIPEQYRCTELEDEYTRVPKRKVTGYALAGSLGIPFIRFKRGLKRIRVAAVDVADEVGLEAIRQLDFYRRRKSHAELD